MIVEFEAVVEDSLHLSGLLTRLDRALRLHHLELDIEITVRLVGDGDGEGLRIADRDRAKVQLLRTDANLAISSGADNLHVLARLR